MMPNAVLLPSGHVLIVNGAQTGYAGVPNYAHQPALTPELYDTTRKEWHQGELASSRVPRVYHASAPAPARRHRPPHGEQPQQARSMAGTADFPTEFRTEFFLPPTWPAQAPPASSRRRSP